MTMKIYEYQNPAFVSYLAQNKYPTSLARLVICYFTAMKDSVKKRIQLPLLIQYLQDKEKLTSNPNYRYDLRNVIMSLNNHSIDAIKQEFLINDNHLDLEKFIWLLRKAIEGQHYDQLINYEFTRLFEEIDVDGSNTIEWSEFLEFLSQSAWAALSTEADSSGRGTLQHDKKILFPAFSQSSKYRKQAIKKIIEIQRNGLIGLVTRDNKLQFIDYHQQQPQDSQIEQEKKVFRLESVDFNKVLSLDYSEEERLFGVLMSNRNLCFIQEGEIHKTIGVIRSTGSQVDIYYLPIHKLWALQSVNSTLHIFPSPKSATIKTKLHFKPHQQPLTAVKEISSPFTICTASLDGTIKLWQTNGRLMIELEAKKEISSQTDAKKGVKGLATYSKGNISYICSWMFTSELFLWLPSLSLSKPFAGELKGHMGLIVNALFTLKGQLVSIDDRRMIKVWNPQKFECIQVLVIEKEAEGLFILKGRPYLVLYSKLMQFFRVRTNSKADLQNEIALSGKQNRNLLAVGDGTSKLIGTSFSAYYSSIIVVTNHQAKILEVNSASLLATILPEDEDEQFVAMSMQRMRRIYIASSKGLIYEYKIEDGSLVKKIPVICQSQIQLRFIYYHESTKMLMVIVEKQNCSELITYDKLAEEEGKIKEIEFNQTGLLSFQFDTLSDKFYVLSQNHLTVWGYQKLNILNKVDISSVIKGQVCEMFLQPTSGSLFFFSKDEIILLNIQEEQVSCERLQLHKDKSKVKLLGGATMKQNIPSSYMEDLKTQKTQRQMMQDKKKKRVNFKEQVQKKQKDDDGFANKQIVQSTAIVLAVADIYGQMLYYNITEYLPIRKNKQAPAIKGKVHRLKEKRIAHMKHPHYIDNIRTLDLSFELFTQQVSYIPKSVKAGTVAGHFYLFSSQSSFYFFNIYGAIKGEWNMSLTKPRVWQIAFNQINLVLARLERTEQVLARINKVDGQSFKIDFLVAKYLTQEELTYLLEYESRKKVTSKLSLNKSKRSLKSIEHISQPSKSQVSFTVLNQLPAQQQKNEFQNVFVRKLQDRDHKKHLQKNSLFYQKVQKSLKAQRPSTSQVIRSNSVKVINQYQEKSPFLQQIQNYFTIGDFNQPPLQQSSVKSSQMQHRKQAKSELKQQKLSLFQKTTNQSALKNRLKSSVSQAVKNFNQAKVEYCNFVKLSGSIISAASGSLGRKGKLHLKL